MVQSNNTRHDPMDIEVAQSSTTTAAPKYPSSSPADEGYHTQRSPLSSRDDVPPPYLSDLKSLMSKLRSFEDSDLGRSQIKVPKIIVVGDQNAGKSSLIERMSSIALPRDDGTCTRCPLQITVEEQDGPWSCTVSLHRKYHFSGDADHLWQPRDEDIEKFAYLENPMHLEAVVRRAQLTLLDPGADPQEFQAAATLTRHPAEEFSPNIVRIHVRSPTCPTLSMIDLPGIITQHQRGDQHVQLVKDLVKDYINDPDAIILYVCPISMDLQTSSAAGLIKACPGALQRCLGIMTKPDTWLDETMHRKQLEAILKNQCFKLQHGYHVTKQPSQSQLDDKISHFDADASEESYFKQTALYKTACQKYPTQFGVQHVVRRVEGLLENSLRLAIPHIMSSIEAKIKDINDDLRQYPAPTTSPATAVWEVYAALEKSINNIMVGEQPHKALKERLYSVVVALRNTLMNQLRPHMAVKPSDAQMIKTESENVIDISEDGDNIPSPPKRKRSALPTRFAERSRIVPVSHYAKSVCPFKINFGAIRRYQHEVSNLDVPDTTHPDAVLKIVALCIQKWEEPVDAALQDISRALNGVLDATLKELLQPWETAPLAENARTCISVATTAILESFKEQVKYRYKLEMKPLTLDKERLSELEAFNLQEMRRERIDYRIQQYRKTTGQKKSVAADLPTDEHEHELELMAKVLALYTLAAARLGDGIYHLTRFQLMDECRTELPGRLRQVLVIPGLQDASHYERLVVSASERETTRQNLLRERARLYESLEAVRTA